MKIISMICIMHNRKSKSPKQNWIPRGARMGATLLCSSGNEFIFVIFREKSQLSLIGSLDDNHIAFPENWLAFEDKLLLSFIDFHVNGTRREAGKPTANRSSTKLNFHGALLSVWNVLCRANMTRLSDCFKHSIVYGICQANKKSASLLFYSLNPTNLMMKNFSFLLSKSPIRFCPKNPIQTGRRAKRGGFLWLAISEMEYIYNKARTHFTENS